MTAFMTAGSAPTVPASPAPLAPRGFSGRHRVAADAVGEGVRTRHRVLHERRGQELARLAVIHDLLHEGLTDALGHAAMDLSRQGQGIDHGADIVDHEVADEVDGARVRVDLHLADVAAVRPGVLLRRERPGLVESRLQARGKLGRLEGGAGHLRDRDGPVRPGHPEPALREQEVRLGRLEQVRGDPLALGNTLSAASHSADPPTTVERDPIVPVPKATRSVSPST